MFLSLNYHKYRDFWHNNEIMLGKATSILGTGKSLPDELQKKLLQKCEAGETYYIRHGGEKQNIQTLSPCPIHTILQGL